MTANADKDAENLRLTTQKKMKAKHTSRINFRMKLTESLKIEVYFLYFSLIVEPEG